MTKKFLKERDDYRNKLIYPFIYESFFFDYSMFIVKSTLSNGLSITVTLVKEWTSFSDNKLLSNKPYTAPNFEHTAFKHNLEM